MFTSIFSEEKSTEEINCLQTTHQPLSVFCSKMKIQSRKSAFLCQNKLYSNCLPFWKWVQPLILKFNVNIFSVINGMDYNKNVNQYQHKKVMTLTPIFLLKNQAYKKTLITLTTKFTWITLRILGNYQELWTNQMTILITNCFSLPSGSSKLGTW